MKDMSLPFKSTTNLSYARSSILTIHRFKFLVISVAIAIATFSLYSGEISVYLEQDLPSDFEFKTFFKSKRGKTSSKSETSLEAPDLEYVAIRKRSSVNLRTDFLIESTINSLYMPFEDGGAFTSDKEAPHFSCLKPVLSRSPPLFPDKSYTCLHL